MANLRTALAQPDDTRVVAAADALVARFRRLGANDRAAIAAQALGLLAWADERLRAADIADAASAVREPSGGDPPAPTNAPTGPAPTASLTEPAPASTTPTTPTTLGHLAGASDSGVESEEDPPTATTVKHPAGSSDSGAESEDPPPPTTAPAEPEAESPED